eukprot:1367774-Amorphochlora_amoeboformis.AAC.1
MTNFPGKGACAHTVFPPHPFSISILFLPLYSVLSRLSPAASPLRVILRPRTLIFPEFAFKMSPKRRRSSRIRALGGGGEGGGYSSGGGRRVKPSKKRKGEGAGSAGEQGGESKGSGEV